MKFLLDSNVLIAAAVGIGGTRLRARMAACDEGDIVTSAIVYAEVVLGSARGKPSSLDRLARFVEEVPVLEFDVAAALAYAGLPFRRASYDLLIAAHAISRGLTVVTDNVGDFSDLPGLSVENWLA